MLERGFDANGCNHQSIGQPFSEVSTIELITKFIKIELQEFPFDSVVHVSEHCFCIGYGRMYPRKHLVPFFGLTTQASAFSTTSPTFTCAVESSMMTSVDSFSQMSFTASFTVSAPRSSMTTMRRCPALRSFFPFLGASTGSLSTITRTFALRWLPLPRLRGSSFSRSSSVVKWASPTLPRR